MAAVPRIGLIALLGLIAGACGHQVGTPADGAPGGCAEVVDAELSAAADGAFVASVTVRSADTGWDRYADRWELVAPDGSVLATRVLAHPHVDEQPFTRSLSGIRIPAGLAVVTVRAHDSVAGFCGRTLEVEVPR